MKTKIALVCALFTCSFSQGAIVTVNGGFNFAFGNSLGVAIPNGTGYIATGFFSGITDILIPTSTITAIDTGFQEFTNTTGVFGNGGFQGFVNFATTDLRVGAASPFFTKNVYVVYGNGTSLLTSTDLAVFKSTLQFPDDAGAASPADLTINLVNAPGSYLMGTPQTINITVGAQTQLTPGIAMATVVPEPSSLLLGSIGLIALLRRKR